jgi:hypothetical protein
MMSRRCICRENEIHPDFGNGSLAITFDFGLEQVTIANGLDENALEFGQPDFRYGVDRLSS